MRVSNCERLTLITCARRLVIYNCLDATFPVFLTSSPVLAGDNRGCRLAPYNTAYPGLDLHLQAAGLPTQSPPAVNHWNVPMDLTSPPQAQEVAGGAGGAGAGTGSPSAAGPAAAGAGSGGGDAGQSGGSSSNHHGGAHGGHGEPRLLPPEQFYTHCIPVPVPMPSPPSTPLSSSAAAAAPPQQLQLQQMEAPFALPTEYAAVLKERSAGLDRLQRQVLGSLSAEQRGGVEAVVVGKFYEWLHASGHLRQVLDLIQLEGQQQQRQQQQRQQEEEDEQGVGGELEGVDDMHVGTEAEAAAASGGGGGMGGQALPLPTAGLIGRFMQEHRQHHHHHHHHGHGQGHGSNHHQHHPS